MPSIPSWVHALYATSSVTTRGCGRAPKAVVGEEQRQPRTPASKVSKISGSHRSAISREPVAAVAPPRRTRGVEEKQAVMDDAPRRRPKIDRTHPDVLGEIQRQYEIPIDIWS